MLKERISQVLLAAVLIGPSLAIGAVHPLTLSIFLGLAAVTMLLVAIGRKGFVIARLDLPAALLGILIVASLLQITPLPASFVQLISPIAFQVQAGALSPLGGAAPKWMFISLDRTLTLMDTGKLLLVLCVYLTANIWTKRFGRTFLFQVIIAAGIITTAVFLGHRVLLADSIFGFYEAHHTIWRADTIHAPLVNPNHLAALLGATAAITIGYAQEVVSRSNRVLLIAIAALIGGALLLTLSRGGIAAFVAGQLVFITLVAANRHGRNTASAATSQRRSFFELSAALLAVIAVGLFAAQDMLVQEFAGGDLSKLDLLREALGVLRGFPLTGSGRGTFGVALPLVSDHSVGNFFTHPENAVLQALVDFGWVLGSIALLAGLIIFSFILKAGMKRPCDGAAIAALAAFGLHNLLDFNMETPAVAVIIATILAIQMGRRSLRVLAGPHLPQVAFAIFGVFVIAFAVGGGIYLPSRHLDAEQRRYESGLDNPSSPLFNADTSAGALERHPADWYLPFAVGVHRYHNTQGNPLPWFARAIRLNYAASGAHLYVGRYLLKTGHLSQGLLELRLAVTYNPRLVIPTARFAVAATQSFHLLTEMAVTREQQELIWPALARELTRVGHPDAADQVDSAILELLPDNMASLNRRARYLAAKGNLDQAFSAAHRLSDRPEALALRAKLLADLFVQANDLPQAIVALTAALAREPRNTAVLLKLALIHRNAGNYDKAILAAGRLANASDTDQKKSRAMTFKGSLHAAAGDFDRALATYRKAHTLNPSNTQALTNIAKLSEKVGDIPRATEALRALRRNEPDNPEWNHRLQRLEDLQQRQRFGI